MAYISVKSRKVKDDPSKHIVLDCLPSPDGDGWYCRMVNSGELSRSQQKTDAEDDSKEPVSPATGKTLDTHQRGQNPAERSLKEDQCGCSAGFQKGDSEEADSETVSKTSDKVEFSPLNDEQSAKEVGEDDGEGGCADDEF